MDKDLTVEITGDLRVLAKELTRIQNQLFKIQMKISNPRFHDMDKDDNDILHFEDEILRDVPHG